MKATQWPKGFVLDEKKKDYATKNGIDYRKLDDFWGEFQDWCEANEKTYKNWDAAFRMRVRKAKQWNLFQGPAKPKVQNTKLINGVANLQAAYCVLQNYGDSAFESYCKRNRLPADDRESVLNKYHGVFSDVKILAQGMLK